jgi:ATP-dependent Clp protease ATP-binding subunit ClpA
LCRTVDDVLENYSVRARRVVSLATAEARGLDHPRVGTEHLLLGLLSDEDGEPAEVLRTAGASLAAARHMVIEAVGEDLGSVPTEALPFTARAQRALERAGRFSRKDREPEVSAGHVLLGVLDVEGLACQVLRGLGVDIVNLRHAVVGTPADVAVASIDEPASIMAVRPLCPHCQAPLDETLAEMVIPARRDGEATNVSVVYCTACGASLGVLRPESQ